MERAPAVLAPQLAGRDDLAGERFTVADGALFHATRRVPEVDRPAPLAAHLARMKARAAAERGLAVRGGT